MLGICRRYSSLKQSCGAVSGCDITQRMVNTTPSCPPKCEGYCYRCGWELATHENTDDTGRVDHKAVLDCIVPATVLKMKLWLGHRCTVISNKNPEVYKCDLNNVLTSKWPKSRL